MTIQEKYEQKMKEFSFIMDYPWHDEKFYAAWLAQTYYYACHGPRILTMAAAHTPMDNNRLFRRFFEHAREEMGHETLAERDMQGIGYKPSDVGEFPVTQAFYQTQYHTIEHNGSGSLFGFILALEGAALVWGDKIRKAVQAGHPNYPVKFLDVHVEHDPDHVDKAFDILKLVPNMHEKDIMVGMDFTVELYRQILASCKEWASRQGKAKKSA